MIVGFGVVGQSLAEILINRAYELKKRFRVSPKIISIVDSKGAAISDDGVDLTKAVFTKRTRGSVSLMKGIGKAGVSGIDIIEAVDAEIVVEVTSTNPIDGEPGLSHIKTALRRGNHVITTNKGPLALALKTLTREAIRRSVLLRFSGTVGGGTYILPFIRHCLQVDTITSLKGVLNGTTNYILTKMTKNSVSMEEALAEARELGYTEADARYDLDGTDVACKITILANCISNRGIHIKDVEKRGINGVTVKELIEADKRGYAIKLVGSLDNSGKAKVTPEIISKENPLCVDYCLNAITIHTKQGMEHTIIGKGAGGTETANSIIYDLVDIAKNRDECFQSLNGRRILDRSHPYWPLESAKLQSTEI